MATISGLALLCIVAAGTASAQKHLIPAKCSGFLQNNSCPACLLSNYLRTFHTRHDLTTDLEFANRALSNDEVVLERYTLKCDKPLVFRGQDTEAACFAKCPPGKCQAVLHMFSGEPGKPTCALMPAGANCTPEPGGTVDGPVNLKLNIPTRNVFPIVKSHSIGGGGVGSGSIAFYHPAPVSRSRDYDGCLAVCQFLGCNAIQTDSDHCALFKFTKRPQVLVGGNDGKSRMCDARSVVYYENDKIAPTGDCVPPG